MSDEARRPEGLRTNDEPATPARTLAALLAGVVCGGLGVPATMLLTIALLQGGEHRLVWPPLALAGCGAVAGLFAMTPLVVAGKPRRWLRHGALVGAAAYLAVGLRLLAVSAMLG